MRRKEESLPTAGEDILSSYKVFPSVIITNLFKAFLIRRMYFWGKFSFRKIHEIIT